MGAVADLSQNPFALLSLIAAPAVLTNAASVLVMSTTNRFLRASERMRALAVRVEEKKVTPGLRALLRGQVDRTERQAVLLLGALRAAYTAIGSFASASLISILGAGIASTSFVRIGFHFMAGLALAVGVLGASALVLACARLLEATRLSMLNMSEEAALIRKHEETLPPT
jgi:Protein of unknown function (DUF2721)